MRQEKTDRDAEVERRETESAAIELRGKRDEVMAPLREALEGA